jgi:hypothetical protein
MSNTVKIHIDANLEWQLERTRRGRILAICEPLGLTLEADSQEEALSLINEGLHYFFLDHLAEGTLQKFLMSKGWKVTTPLPPNYDPGDAVTFDVPFSLRQLHAA